MAEPVLLAAEQAKQTAQELLAGALASGSSRIDLVVRGGCMAPLLRDGDRVIVEPLGAPPPLGALVLVSTAEAEPGRQEQAPRQLVCHRYLGRAGDDAVLLGGDRHGSGETQPAAAVLGLVRGARRGRRSLCLDGPLARCLDRLQARLLWRAARQQQHSPAARRPPLDRLLHWAALTLAWFRSVAWLISRDP